jgi:hypothetical protein
MTDRFSGKSFSDPQSAEIKSQAKARKFSTDKKASDEKQTKNPTNLSELYAKGVEHLKKFNFTIELCEGGDHVRHRILRPAPPQEVNGITYPASFQPLQDISSLEDFKRIERAFESAETEVRDFWAPVFRPEGGENDLMNFSERLIKMRRIQQNVNIHDELDYEHTFDPDGTLTGNQAVRSPRVWVPARAWFDEKLHKVTLTDVFTIFPEAEIEMLKMIVGRVGVGRSNHKPPNFPSPIDHTARMAAVVVGKDAGLGKSTLFNGLTAAFSKCGFVTHTFKSTEDRFGLKAAALADIAYKDDTAMRSLKGFLAAEETKILVTNGLFQTEEKFQNAEQIWPKCVMIVNSNDWDAHFAYDLDPGIIDRIKILSTYREYEVRVNRDKVGGTPSEGTPDLRPHTHIPFLADKLGVSADALYLWCLRLATDRFWSIITDKVDPTVNRLQYEVRYWTTRQRIRFKADTSQALVNAMAMAAAIRNGGEIYHMPELTPDVLARHLKDLQFLGLDKSGKQLMSRMKADWEEQGRPGTHFYQGLREIRWESVQLAIETHVNGSHYGSKTPSEAIKEIMGKLVMRDGFKISTGISYVIEDWQHTRFALNDVRDNADRLRTTLSESQRERLCDRSIQASVDWIADPNYSPDRAEEFRPDME